MKIKYHKRFEKQFKKLSPDYKKKVAKVIEIFVLNPVDYRLKNHTSLGKLKGKRAISVSSDLRIIFEEHQNYALVIFLDIGTHNRVYP